ncbi:MFS transporter [Actinoplanes derwentensis]|uniref:Predicted arabinose efflux permease, MFS family n=1 Tax=Actinoplanes derwentensis TaxID=113562 RepID=A0A1H1TEC4_9ACTN|nr:MFS transporter [Actinoplanes derwentensis]GID89486.1 hypothetical protein Ade03nite_84100 [Actinoplanes derwentensis]SDS57879.1 Predicted arabinose efflux permease, MFS family [Actinoplanes derwentensis]
MTGPRPAAALGVTALALGVDMFLYGALVPILPTLPAVDGSVMASGLLFGAYAIAMLLAIPPVGIWVDRAGPRTPFVAGLAGLAVATLLFALATGLDGSYGLTLLCAARAAQGMAAAVSWTAGLSLIAATHPPEQRGRAMGTALSAIGIGVLLGPAIGGPLADAFGPRAPFLVVAALALADAAARILLIRRIPHHVRTGGVYRELATAPRFPLLAALTVLGATAIAFPEPVLPLHLFDLGLGSTGIGLAFAGAALAGSAAAPLAGALADRTSPQRVAAAGALITAAGFLLAGRHSPPWSITGLALVAVGAQLVLAPTLALVGTLAESRTPPSYGAAYALYNLAYTGGLAIAPVAAGSLTATTSISTATLVTALVALLVAAVLARPEKVAASGQQSP